MLHGMQSDTEIDRELRRACNRFACDIGRLSSDVVLREGVLRAGIAMLAKSLETEFEGYGDALGEALLAHGQLISDHATDR